GALGPEVGPVAARHSAQRATRAAPIGILTGLGSAVTGIVSPTLGDLVGGIGGFAGALVLAPYSRGQEREADQVGQELAAKAGWDPSGLPASLRTLEREDALHPGEKRPASFFATHPPLPDRVVDTETRAAQLVRTTAAPIARSRAEFLQKLDGLVVGPRARDGVFEGQTFRQPDLDFHVQFPAGWKTVNERSIVGAGAPDGRAVIGLEVAGAGNAPAAALRDFERKTTLDPGSPERLTVNGLPARHATVTARTRGGRVALDLTWIAHAGHVYRFTGVAEPDAMTVSTPLF